jgi:tRNA nucleotidyltransferase (CCA-adding enzyme)
MQRYLLHTSPAFSEDPLRVLRGAQFVARFGLMVMPELVAESLKLGREQAWDQLSRERIWGEWIKLLLKGRGIWAGLRFLRDTGWLVATPAIHRLVGCEQNPDWHPEGDAFTHTGQCMDHYALERVGDTAEDLIVGLAVLLHDAGKPDCMERDEDGTIRTLGHNKAGVPWARKFIEEMVGLPQHFLDCVLPLVEHHMAPLALYQSGATDKAVRRLARRVIRIDRLVRVFRADTGGRGMAISQERELISEWLLAWARKLDCEAQQPVQIVMGRHLIEYAGYNQSKRLGRALKALYELQLDGRVTNVGDGVAYAVQWLSAGRIPELTNTGGSNQ